jgi:hypothetical protein
MSSKFLRKLAKSIVPFQIPKHPTVDGVKVFDDPGELAFEKYLLPRNYMKDSLKEVPFLPEAVDAAGITAAVGANVGLTKLLMDDERQKEAERQRAIAEGGEVISPGDIGMTEFARRYPELIHAERRPVYRPGLLENMMMH